MASMQQQFSGFMSSTAELDVMAALTAAMTQTEDDVAMTAPAESNILDELAFIDMQAQAAAQQPAQQPGNTQICVQNVNPSASLTPAGVIPLQLDQNQLQHKAPPITSPVTPPSTTAFGMNMKRKATAPPGASTGPPPNKKPALLSNFGGALAKTEPLLVSEPVTPSASQRATNTAAIPNANAQRAASSTQPLSPLCDSTSSDDEDSQGYRLSPTSPLPAPSAQQAAKRRALRSRALKRARARASAKAESSSTNAVVKSAPNGNNDGGSASADEDPDVPLDKKVARAIRNRQAAQRSRVEAKAKMQKLSEDNDELATTVESLRAENKALQKQLQALLKHTFGEGHNVEEVLSVFSRVKDNVCA